MPFDTSFPEPRPVSAGRASRSLPARPAGSSAGFTLIEIMVVVVILSILAGFVLPKIMDQPNKARVVKAKMQMESYGMALKQFKMDNGFYPATEQGLDALVKKPTTGRIPKNYPEHGYIDKISEDPWGAPYIYISPTDDGEFEIISRGADNEDGGEGDDADINSRNLD
mgnify:CR=1 FL=1